MIKKCEVCGKEYILNPYFRYILIPENLDPEIIENLKYVPSCDCFLKENEESLIKSKKSFKKNNLKRKIQKYKDVSVIDAKFLESTFEKADLSETPFIRAKKYAENFILKNGSELGIIFYGPSGTGKTFATACIANYLMAHGKTVLVFSLDLYLNKIKEKFKETEEELLTLVKNADLLVLDDFGGESTLSEWAISKIFNLIDTRYRAKKPVLISTNLRLNKDKNQCELFKKFQVMDNCRIKDRIKSMCFPIKLGGDSKRKILKQQFLNFIGEADS